MRKRNNKKAKAEAVVGGVLILLLTAYCLVPTLMAQSGGNYTITRSVVAGGGSRSTGGDYTVEGTVGQAVAGSNSTGGTYSLRSGFWSFRTLRPTAATVSLNGRVVISGGSHMSRTRIILTDAISGMVRVALPNSFGHYSFDELEVGHFYIIRPESPLLTFTPLSYEIMLLDTAKEIDFTGQQIP